MSATIRYCYVGLLLVMLLANVIDVPVYLHMIVTTMLIIYIGSHQSVVAEESLEGIERMSSKDAYMFPVIGSIFLFSLYVVFKFLPKEYVNIVIKAYFFVFGVFILANNIHKLVNLWVDKNTFEKWDAELFRCRIPFFGHKPEDKAAAPAGTTGVKKVTVAPSKGDERAPLPSPNPKAAPDGSTIFSKLDLVCYFLAILFGVWYVAVNHWSATNVFGIFFSIQGIEFLSLGSFFNGVVLLSGLFVYDVFWVFGTDVMVTVAKSFDAPIKLLFPRPAGASPSMLGLGDIVIPGIFIALMLRFDYKLAGDKNPVKTSHFRSVMVGYFVGLTTTVGVMYHFQAAQPALLYLVPTCLGSAVLCAVATGNFSKLWNFSEGEPTQEEHRDEDLKNKAADTAASGSGAAASDADEGAGESADSAAESSAAEDNDDPKPSNARLRRSRSRKDN